MKKHLLFAAATLASFYVSAQTCPPDKPISCTSVAAIAPDPNNTVNITNTTAVKVACVDTPITFATKRISVIGTGALYVNSSFTGHRLILSGTSVLRVCCGAVITIDTLNMQLSPNALLSVPDSASCQPACIVINKLLNVTTAQFIPSHIRICMKSTAIRTGAGVLSGQPITFNCADCNQALPIILESFTAASAGRQTLLKWKVSVTGSSIIANYRIRRSVDGVTFESLATLRPGTNEWVDVATPTGKTLYQLSIQDVGGSIVYSPIAAVSSVAAEGNMISVSGVLYRLKNSYSANVPMMGDLYDLSGRKIASSSFTVGDALRFDGRQPGIYVIQIRQGLMYESFRVTLP